MRNKIIKFPQQQSIGQDESGFQTETYKWISGVPACFKSSTRNDEILAYQMGYTADVIVEIDAVNYPGSTFFIDEETGDYYYIRRSYKKENSRIVQLTAERRDHGTVQG